MTEECFFANHKGTDCIIQPITCQEGLCSGCQVYKDWVGHQRTMGRLHGSITPRWLEEQEKEQSDKIAILRRQIRVKRDEAFASQLTSNGETREKMWAATNAYDVCLKLIRGII